MWPIKAMDRGFVDSTGKPWFWMGDTLWHIGRDFALDDVREIFQDRQAKGFTVVLAMAIGWEEEPKPNINGDMPWNDEPGEPNPRYYDHLAAVVRLAEEFQILIVLGVYHKTQERIYTLDSARESARWISERFRNTPNLAFSMYPEAHPRFLPIVRALADGLREGDAGRHPITIHPDPAPQSSSFYNDEPWIAWHMLQVFTDIELAYPMTLSDVLLSPTRPVVMAEGGYEGVEFGREITPLDIRRQAWWSFKAGGHTVYGHVDNFMAPSAWRDWIDSPGSLYMAVFRRIVESLPNWWRIAPDPAIVPLGAGDGLDLVCGARSHSLDWMLVYFSSARSAMIRLNRVRSTEDQNYCWIDPMTGDHGDAQSVRGVSVKEFTVPAGWEDALLLVTAN